jgi:sialate O-acetylesterase
MAVTIDIGEAGNIHPKNKQDVGKRLTAWALAKVYGRDVVASGPLYKSHEKRDGKIVVAFGYVGGGLVAKDGEKLRGFAIAGEDKKWEAADAAIDGETVVVSSPKVQSPVAVRYAWANNPSCNLYNKADLPASPFRTDDWPLLEER